ncbi:unnamed protein product [Arctia plantaginis]|uniref:RBR-type E3 ubiquitin transferase n=1 Tax=Arctia plantaginis TaxID=874455 RepID=A0A8S0ZF28_ARCPL|nr:unnamed protein product [Arctia plantaginis]
MLKGRGRDPRSASLTTPPPAHLHAASRPPTILRSPTPSMHKAQPASRPEPDYEVVEFPGEQYVNAKLQPPPPPPPRPPTGHPPDAGASCGLCGGGGARVRCAECGRRALCASCDDMYHRHPKRRNHQRQALSQSQLRDERPPLPPKAAPPVPPPRRHKVGGDRMSASPKPPMLDQRHATLNHTGLILGTHIQNTGAPVTNHHVAQQQARQQMPLHLQTKITSTPTPSHVGSMPFLPTNTHLAAQPFAQTQGQTNTLSHMSSGWNRSRGSLQGFGMHPNMAVQQEPWDSADNMGQPVQNWGRPMRRGASVLELSGVGAAPCAGCAHCASMPWRYGSCANLDHPWAAATPGWPATCCSPPHPHNVHVHPHPHVHPPQTPQSYRRVESRAASRAASRAGSRAASPAVSVRSRTSRRPKHRTPSPPPLPSSDADSESESESYDGPTPKPQDKNEDFLGPAPAPPSSTWQCEHCTYVNEPGVRVCVICCRTPTTVPRPIITSDISENIERLKITPIQSPSLVQMKKEPNTERVVEKTSTKITKERTSTGCGPSPPRDGNILKKPVNRLVTPTREPSVNNQHHALDKHDMAVGPSPPREIQNGTHMKRDISTDVYPPSDANKTMRVSPYKESQLSSGSEAPKRHSISVGPSPPRENLVNNSYSVNVPKRSTGTSPPRDTVDRGNVKTTSRVSNTGTSPPPQSISTQTYEVPKSWDRAPSASRSRPRRRFRDDSRRERSHSRHSLSSDTRESDRSVRTTGPGNRWEWRERDSSPGGDWADSYTQLSRRASHLDLRRTRATRRSSFYGSEAPSPERQPANRAISLEALASAGGSREAERGIELAQLMSEAERLGFSAAEVQAALTQSPAAPLAWLRERWPSLCAGVRAAAVRLAPAAAITDMEARAALARHRGAMWPAVTECVERHRRQTEVIGVGEEGRLRGHVWGSPVGADDDAAPPRSPSHHSHRMREDSSDEFEAPIPTKFQDDDWMYLPLNVNINDYERDLITTENTFAENYSNENKTDIAKKLKQLLQEAGVPRIDENLLVKDLLSGNSNVETGIDISRKPHTVDLIQSENDFIDAYNALTRSSPLPNLNENFNRDLNTVIRTNSKVNTTNEKLVLNNNNHFNNVPKDVKPSDKNLTEVKQSDYNVTVTDAAFVNLNNESHQHEEQIKDVALNKLSQENISQEEAINGISNKPFIKNTQQVSQTKKEPSILDKNKSLEEITTERDFQKQAEEKSNNLSEMVDNTQKLIQQMKEEINSDINSIDGRTKSQSEIDTSSEETNDEQESSYSDTEERSENLTSDEKEISSSEDESSVEEQSDKRQTIRNRTSSEDNENFEEALDHVEHQLEDFKNANIEMLNSIARTLQEEHTFTLEIDQIKARPPKKQDLNNNLFTAVNSFEEIYEELNTKTSNSREAQKDIKIEIRPKTINLLAKETIIHSVNKTETPFKLLITENKLPILTAKIENVQELQNVDDANNTQQVHIVTAEHVKKDLYNYSQNHDQVNQLKTKDNENSHLRTDFDENIHQKPMSNTNQSEINDLDIIIEPSESLMVRDQSEPLVKEDHINEANIEITKVNTSNEDPSYKEKTPEVLMDKTSPINNNNRNPIYNKSNIPKLIKIVTNNKMKADKNSPKLVVSKVPVRRTSIKQYPAPAPPKSHFGNIQSGHVKQLQTRLFNNKVTPPKSVSDSPKTTEVIASTSTFNKKKPAPQPPTTQLEEQQVLSPKISSPPKEKKQYFRETCRTEDEWTDSDSDDSQSRVIRPSEEAPLSPPSPPPPLTLRRVSGQLIDLAKIRLPEGSPERQARMLLAEGATETWEQAQLAVELVSRGADPPAALLAALECSDLDSALAYLYQDCELCASRLPEHEMVSMLRCTHRCCRECAHLYFTVQITERSIADCVCPFCKLPELENLPEDSWLEYFAHLDILLKTLLEADVHELFQRKLRDRTLARDPNFRWCMECSSGFFVHPKQKKIRCPECRSVSCAACRKPWTTNHEGLTCEQYTAWVEDNDQERSLTAIQQHLRDNGLECPRCHFKYSLSRGGCMHFTCTQCKYEFCYGCGKPFTMGARCGLSDYCAKLGLHSHHPRNCLFYLRDKEPHELQTLLQMNNVKYETETAEGSTGRCPVQLQRETPTGLIDGICGSEAPANYAGLCKGHYVEYLAGLARGLDPIPIMDVTELVAELRRRAITLPERGPWDTDPIYAGMCAEIVKEKIPLD